MNAQATPGLNRVYWAFQGKPPERPPLSPAQRRDSAMIATRIHKVVDSLSAAGGNRAQLTELANNLLSGNLGGGFGGGGGGAGVLGAEPEASLA